MASRHFTSFEASRSKGFLGRVRDSSPGFEEEVYGDPVWEMKKLRQKGSHANYFRRLDSLLNQVQVIEILLEEEMLSIFI